MDHDDKTPARTPSSLRMSHWGLLDVWMQKARETRAVVVTSGERGGLLVTVIDSLNADETKRERVFEVPDGTEPSVIAWQVVSPELAPPS